MDLSLKGRTAFITGAIDFLSLPTPKLREMGAAGSEHVRKNYSFDRQLEQTLALYRRLATLKQNAD